MKIKADFSSKFPCFLHKQFSYPLLLISFLLISSCSSDVQNLEDLKVVSFEENPTLFNGFRLGYQPDSVGLHFRHYNIYNYQNSPDAFCLKCKKWRFKSFLAETEKHSWDFILHSEGFGFLDQPNSKNETESGIIPTKNPNVYYVKNGPFYKRTINAGDNLVYQDEIGNSFFEDEPIIYFTESKGEGVFSLWSSKSLPKGIHGSCLITGDLGKDTIITDFEIVFKSENNHPIQRLIFNADDNGFYRRGDIVDFTDEGFEEYYSSVCSVNYIPALNQKEVEQIIKYFEKKFGKKKYNTRGRSGTFKKLKNKSFYREYKWSVGIVNIILTIDDYPPTNVVTSAFENPYNKLGEGYCVKAKFELNDKVLNIIEKEN